MSNNKKPLTPAQEVEAAMRFLMSVNQNGAPKFNAAEQVQTWVKDQCEKFGEELRRETEPNAFEEP